MGLKMENGGLCVSVMLFIVKVILKWNDIFIVVMSGSIFYRWLGIFKFER